MSTFKDQVAWVTGGGTGIGLACAVELARQGARVVVSGRRADRLQGAVAQIEAAGGAGLAVQCDVTDEAIVQAAVATIVQAWGRLDVVLSNAGFSVAGKIDELSDADWRRQLDVNLFGTLHVIRHTLPELRKTDGRIALVGSVAAFLPARKVGAYSASKAAIRSIGETLSAELSGQGVSCTTIHPGFVESEIAFVDNQGVYHADRKDKRPAWLMWKAEDAARVMVRGIARRQRELVFTGHGKLAVALARLVPSFAAWAAQRA
jgi:NAD(P)-dependent dehydrogenase (short-subunit alcohol dehydrogenase family)